MEPEILDLPTMESRVDELCARWARSYRLHHARGLTATHMLAWGWKTSELSRLAQVCLAASQRSKKPLHELTHLDLIRLTIRDLESIQNRYKSGDEAMAASALELVVTTLPASLIEPALRAASQLID
jgi:hypothetical protein